MYSHQQKIKAMMPQLGNSQANNLPNAWGPIERPDLSSRQGKISSSRFETRGLSQEGDRRAQRGYAAHQNE
jgi:hypothetical protein